MNVPGDPIEGGLCNVPFGLEGVDPVFQVDIQLNKPILEGAIEPLQFFRLGCQLCFEGRAPTLNAPILISLTRKQAF
jgi:hypothetical protein